MKFCEEHVGKKVGDGQCAALPQEALAAAGAKGMVAGAEGGGSVWGTPVGRIEEAIPGDLVHFRNVTILVQAPNGTRAVRHYPEHTAVVARNRGGGVLDLYEQNVAAAGGDADRRGRTRRRATDFRGVTGGEVRVFRPVGAEE